VRDRACQWFGKTFDLASAYRQIAVSRSSMWVAYVAVYNPDTGKPEVFQMHALPFGATMSVFSFLRVAHSLWFLGARCWYGPTTLTILSACRRTRAAM
jgi:hypothetical protein